MKTILLTALFLFPTVSVFAIPPVDPQAQIAEIENIGSPLARSLGKIVDVYRSQGLTKVTATAIVKNYEHNGGPGIPGDKQYVFHLKVTLQPPERSNPASLTPVQIDVLGRGLDSVEMPHGAGLKEVTSIHIATVWDESSNY